MKEQTDKVISQITESTAAPEDYIKKEHRPFIISFLHMASFQSTGKMGRPLDSYPDFCNQFQS